MTSGMLPDIAGESIGQTVVLRAGDGQAITGTLIAYTGGAFPVYYVTGPDGQTYSGGHAQWPPGVNLDIGSPGHLDVGSTRQRAIEAGGDLGGGDIAVLRALAATSSPFTAGPIFARLNMPEAGADLRDFGGDLGGGDAALALAAGGPLVAGGALLLSRLLAMLPAAVRGAAAAVFRGMGQVGARIGWNRLPSWLQQVLIFSGVTAGIDIIIDTGADDRGLVQLPGTSDLSIGQMGGISIVGSWTANGVKFVKLSDGRLGAQNKRGMWKFWRPKKPIVLFASGASNINTFLRADAALNRQSKRLKAAIQRRAPAPRRVPKAVQGQVVSVDGTRIVRNG